VLLSTLRQNQEYCYDGHEDSAKTEAGKEYQAGGYKSGDQMKSVSMSPTIEDKTGN
jgi:hypothetical protein